ncbi:uncharacterized protein V1513DRAFT_434384 [Lipomyces chichibuensis]|uniref:uncharacterized protein n=1 Tax=Lipomyces chichibuensis TaxID=1546026 RepID=UPI0033440F2B
MRENAVRLQGVTRSYDKGPPHGWVTGQATSQSDGDKLLLRTCNSNFACMGTPLITEINYEETILPDRASGYSYTRTRWSARTPQANDKSKRSVGVDNARSSYYTHDPNRPIAERQEVGSRSKSHQVAAWNRRRQSRTLNWRSCSRIPACQKNFKKKNATTILADENVEFGFVEVPSERYGFLPMCIRVPNRCLNAGLLVESKKQRVELA